ncbi:MAG: nucleotidyltransferase domain-containing protein [Spirochaetes bacterium]|nr:nucleotidyltransferase domain-containing protein [Spirochaetota bacterium]
MLDKCILKKIEELKKQDYNAIALMGSYARGDEKKYSDVDIVCFLKDNDTEKKAIINFIDNKYVVISFLNTKTVANIFSNPKEITEYLYGLKTAKILFDHNKYLNNLILKAKEFKWTNEIQKKANFIASKEMVGWIEEVQKAIQGLLINDIGRMLNGLHGLTFGIFNIIRIQKGILLYGENTFFEQIINYYKNDNDFYNLSKIAFGIDKSTISERVIAGLKLYDRITTELFDIICPEDKNVIQFIKNEISNIIK